MLGTTLIIVMIILMGLSIAMIASVSFPKGYKDYKNNYYPKIFTVKFLKTSPLCSKFLN